MLAFCKGKWKERFVSTLITQNPLIMGGTFLFLSGFFPCFFFFFLFFVSVSGVMVSLPQPNLKDYMLSIIVVCIVR